MKILKVLLAVALFTTIASPVRSQEIQKSLTSFSGIIASPKINLILNHGDQEGIRLIYNGVSSDKINIKVKGKTLHIYLDDAKVTEKLERISHHHKKSIYENVTVTAYVTYRDLDHLEIRGDQELTCHDLLSAEKFTLKAYGENEINLTALESQYLKTNLYGENRLKIKSGKVAYQRYKLYGENRIDTRGVKSFSTSATIYGDNIVRVSTQDELHISSFGEADVAYNGNADVSKGLVIGRTQIRKLD